MDNFFDEIKDNLENRPQPEFEESAWLAMQNKMQEEDHPRRRAAGWWWLSWFVIPLLLSNGWMYVQMEKTEVLLHKMELQRDTIYKTQIIYQTDTIYQSNISQQEIVNSLPVYSQKTSEKTILLQNNFLTESIFKDQFDIGKLSILSTPVFQNRASRNYWNSILSSSKNLSPEQTNTAQTEEGIITSVATFQVSPFIPSWSWSVLKNPNSKVQLLDLESVTIFKEKSIWKKRAKNLTASFRPKGFNLGASGGFVFPSNKNLDNREGYSFGLYGAIDFSNNLRLWAEAIHVRLSLKTFDLDNAFGIPTITKPNDNYIFEKAVADQPFYQMSMGMQYLIPTKKRWNPYVGLGYSVAALQPYEAEYEYLDEPGGNEVIFPKDVSIKGLIHNLWLVNAGVEYRFSKKWYGQIEGYYRASWESESNLTPNILGAKTRLLYKF